MVNEAQAGLCPEEKLEALVSMVGEDETRGTYYLEDLLGEHPEDARLHFLKGSLLAGRQDYTSARASMRQAVDLAPDFEIARFQLGFLLLTCGEPHAAQEAWGPLHGLAPGNYLRIFVQGLCHLIRDEFDDAITALQDGIARNSENPAMNNDMQLIIGEVRRKLSASDEDVAPVSSAHLLLQQAAFKATKH